MAFIEVTPLAMASIKVLFTPSNLISELILASICFLTRALALPVKTPVGILFFVSVPSAFKGVLSL